MSSHDALLAASSTCRRPNLSPRPCSSPEQSAFSLDPWSVAKASPAMHDMTQGLEIPWAPDNTRRSYRRDLHVSVSPPLNCILAAAHYISRSK